MRFFSVHRKSACIHLQYIWIQYVLDASRGALLKVILFMQILMYIYSNHVSREYSATMENMRNKEIKGNKGMSATGLFLEQIV